MIRLPSTHVAITAPLVTSSTRYPGIPIGQSRLDGREFTLSPVLVQDAELPSTNSLGLGGLGSGKSTTGKVRARREILHHGHQYVVIDSFGDSNSGEWAALSRSLDGLVIDAASFTLNPCSELLPPQVREQLLRSLILAVEPDALTPQATHALQHALTAPKASSLGGLVDALTGPEDGRWPAARLAEWGVGVAIALSRYTDGSLRGLFDGEDAKLPPVDVPIISFDFSRLDRNSPAIPSLMAAVTCWVEHVWLPQSTAVHRHLVLEEAWQILLSPATAKLIQRLLKFSRRAGLSLDVLMHTLSDLGEGAAQDLARLCEVVHVGRLGPEEAAIVGSLLGLPAWAIARIPRLGPGEAVWKIGPDYVDVVQTLLTEEEAQLTDTSSRRRQAQEAYAAAQEQPADPAANEGAVPVEQEAPGDDDLVNDGPEQSATLDDLLGAEEDWAWDMPPNVIDVRDVRHETALRAAREGRCSEAADIAALGEREDIAAHGINSPEAVEWLNTRAQVADLCGTPGQAQQLRATVARMGHTTIPPITSPHAAPSGPEETIGPTGEDENPRRRRVMATVAVAALGLTAGLAWMTNGEDPARTTDAKAAVTQALKDNVGTPVTIDGVTAHVQATWTGGDSVVIALTTDTDSPEGAAAQMLRLDVGEETASARVSETELARSPEVSLPVSDPAAPVTVRVVIGGKTWTEGSRAHARQIRLDPATGTATDITNSTPNAT
ncbi:hypothetical protein ABZ778_29575 [Streptomyces bacillaris]|uniref:hypothetical protein n=1 Tax=Streptomyces bacillaris TaxID=68179 RepID=UPI00345F9C96